MLFDWDDLKAEYNLRKHGVPFSRVVDFDFDLAQSVADERRSYGEDRMIAYAPLDGRLHCLVYVIRADTFRIISLRRANARERAAYDRRKAR